MTDKELVMKLEEDISWLEQGCTTEKEICEHIKQAKETIIHHKETANPWHTGTPTEEGWYLFDVGCTIPFRVAYMRKSQWLSTDDSIIRTDAVIAWQRIEPFKEED